MRIIVRKQNSEGDWYWIPIDELLEFEKLIKRMADATSPTDSDAHNLFSNQFQMYWTKGDENKRPYIFEGEEVRFAVVEDKNTQFPILEKIGYSYSGTVDYIINDEKDVKELLKEIQKAYYITENKLSEAKFATSKAEINKKRLASAIGYIKKVLNKASFAPLALTDKELEKLYLFYEKNDGLKIEEIDISL